MSERSFKLSNGETIEIKTFTGEVLESNKTRHTTVHQEKASVGANIVVPGQVYSEVHTEHEVWLRDAEGKEKAINFGELNVPIRTGHQVTVFYAALEKAQSWKMVMVKNDSTGTLGIKPELRDELNANISTTFKGILKLLGIPIVGVAGTVFIARISGKLGDLLGLIGLGLSAGYFVYKYFNIWSQHRKIEEELVALMKGLAQA